MALRLLEVILPEGDLDRLKGVFRTESIRGGPWRHAEEGGRRSVRVLVEAEESGRLADAIAHRCGDAADWQLMIHAVQAALPRPRLEQPLRSGRERRSAFGGKAQGLSREELYVDARDMSKPTRVYFATVVLSTIVVAVGLLTNNIAAIVGAMVIAPLLGPNMGLALATTLADGSLARRALLSGGAGLVLALLLCGITGLIATVDVTLPAIAARTHVGLGDPLLALAAGSAGALALTTGVPMSLVGVMVAVALLPPTAVVGLLLGSGHYGGAGGAGLLVATNIVCIVLSASVTFLVQGIRPGTWWEAARAARSRRIVLALISLLLAGLVVLILLAQPVSIPGR